MLRPGPLATQAIRLRARPGAQAPTKGNFRHVTIKGSVQAWRARPLYMGCKTVILGHDRGGPAR
jgi:hypothetical protein